MNGHLNGKCIIDLVFGLQIHFLPSLLCIFRVDIQGSHGPGGENQERGYTWPTSPFRLVTIKAQYKAALSLGQEGVKLIKTFKRNLTQKYGS